jgi:uncharacterized membrane protein YhaH (DUF805 family)
MRRTRFWLVVAGLANILTPVLLAMTAVALMPDAGFTFYAIVLFAAGLLFAVAAFIPGLERKYRDASRRCLTMSWGMYGCGWLSYLIATGKVLVDTYWG